MIRFPKILFVTGTDTDVGKTFISALLTKGLQGGYWKPVQTGQEYDRRWVETHTQLPFFHFFSERFLLQKPLCPYLAAEEEKCTIQLSDFTLPNFSPLPHLIIEGCGGVLVPLNEEHFVIDLAAMWKLPLLIVARNSLGTINHTLLTIKEIRRRSLPIFGVILNGKKEPFHKECIERFGRVSVLAEIEKEEDLSPARFDQIFSETFGAKNLALKSPPGPRSPGSGGLG